MNNLIYNKIILNSKGNGKSNKINSYCGVIYKSDPSNENIKIEEIFILNKFLILK
jgi:hypothetical protein